MALPGGIAQVVVTGEFLDSSGQPLQGRIAITPTADLTDPGNSVVIPAVTRAYTLSRGRFTSDPLVATDNGSITPAGWAYQVQISLADLDPITYEILLPQDVTPVDLATLTPVAVQPAVSAYLTLAGGTVSGPLTVAGGLQIPQVGVASGDILTSDGSGNASWEPLSVELPSATGSSQGAVQLTADLGGTAGAPHVVHTNLTAPLPFAQGGTNAGSASAALTSLGAAAATALTAETSRAEAAEVAISSLREFPVALYAGADSTGGTDSSAAIASAISAATAAGGGIVSFGPGTWKFSTINVAGSAASEVVPSPLVHFRFAGASATILTPQNSNSPLFQVQSGHFAAGVRLTGGFTVKAHSSGSTGPAIDLTSCRQWIIESPSYLDSLSGGSGTPGTYAQVIGLGTNTYACRIVDPLCESQRLGSSFIGSIDRTTVIANGNTIENPLLEANTGAYMIDAAGTAGLNIINGIIEGNTVTAAIRLGFQTRVRGVHFEANAAYAMSTSGDAITPGTCYLDSNIYNSGSGTLTIPAGANSGTLIIGNPAALTVSDATESYLQILGANITGAQGINLHSPLRHGPVTSATTTGTVTLDPSKGDYQRVLPTGTVLISSTTGNQSDGQDLVVEITQPASGGPCLVGWGSQWVFAGGSAPNASTAASTVDVFAFRYNATAARWIEQYRHLGYQTATVLQGIYYLDTYTGTDDQKMTSALAAVFAASPAGGTIVLSPRTHTFVNQWATTYSSGVVTALKIQGAGVAFNGTWGTPSAATVCDMQYAGAGAARIDMQHTGTIEITGILFEDTVASTVPFFQATEATPNLHDNVWSGNASVSGTTCYQDAIVLGGTGTTGNSGDTVPYQGYQGQIYRNFFHRIRRACYFRSAANSAQFHDNTVSITCGSNLYLGACVEIVGPNSSTYCTGNGVYGNCIEINGYPVGVKGTAFAQGNTLGPNGFFDAGSNTFACYWFDDAGTGKQNEVIDGFHSGAFIYDPANANTTRSPQTGQGSYFNAPVSFRNTMLVANGGAGPIAMDSNGNRGAWAAGSGVSLANPSLTAQVTAPTQVTDGSTINGANIISSITAAWAATDIGEPIAGTGLPSGAFIQWAYTPATALPWQASAAYTAGQVARPTSSNSHLYQVTTAGTTSASQPTWPTSGGTVTDGSVVWTDLGTAATAALISHPATATNTGVTTQFGRASGSAINMTSFSSHHINSSGSAPTALALTAAGSGATASAVGTDIAHLFTLNTGTSPSAGGSVCGATFSLPFASAPHGISIAPGSSPAAALLAGGYWLTTASTAWSMSTTNAPPASTSGLTFFITIIK